LAGFLLDTNVISEVARRRPDPSVVERLRAIASADLYTTSICVMELRFGAARHPSGPALWQRILREILAQVNVLGFGPREALRAGDLLADLEARGARIGIEDVAIAATALVNDMVLVTRNRRHFDRVPGLAVESWWRS